MSDGRPRVAIAPADDDGIRRAVERGGGVVTGVSEADALIWTDPGDSAGLGEYLGRSPARWVQLPFAGIEGFFAAGVIDFGHTWTCAKGIYGHSTAEHALALMLAAARRFHFHLPARTWRGTRGLGAPERRLADSTVVIVGTGGIGRALAGILVPLRARVVAVNRSGRPLEDAVRTVSVDRLGDVVAEADFVVLAAAATDDTRHLVGADLLAGMKDGAWIVNVARGSLVDTAALVGALEDGRIGGAALDVTDPEPLPDGHPLWALDNAIVTPHVANTWDMAVPELAGLVERNVARFAAGEPLEGVVDPELGY